MAKVITFSTVFPSYHKRAGQPTFFVEKFWKSIRVPIPCSVHSEQLENQMMNLMFEEKAHFFGEKLFDKHTTIRAGHRWKKHDYFSPRIWSGKPYQSKQIIIADDTEIKNVFKFEIKDWRIHIDGRLYYEGEKIIRLNPSGEKHKTLLMLHPETGEELNREFIDRIELMDENLLRLAMNDGLTPDDLLSWFRYPKDFEGQIITWNDKIKY